jgi:hypothetical protein
MSSFLYTQADTPGADESVVKVTAHQIATGTDLPPGVSFTPAERDALLALDPFYTGASLATPRFVPLDTVIELGAGLAHEHSQTVQTITEGGHTLTAEAKSQMSSTSAGDPMTDLTLTALAYGGSAAASGMAAATMAYFGSHYSDLDSKSDFKKLGEAMSITLPDLYTNTTTTNVTTSYGRTTLLEETADNTVTQRFFLQDTNEGMSVEVYYDTFFGTYAFLPVAP